MTSILSMGGMHGQTTDSATLRIGETLVMCVSKVFDPSTDFFVPASSSTTLEPSCTGLQGRHFAVQASQLFPLPAAKRAAHDGRQHRAVRHDLGLHRRQLLGHCAKLRLEYQMRRFRGVLR